MFNKNLFNVISSRVAAAADSRSVAWVCALRFGKEFFCVFFIVLPALNTQLASAVAGLAAVEAEGADVVFAGGGGNVRAGHETVYTI